MSERNGRVSFPAYIQDGCTLDGYINEREGLYPSVTFKFRPAIRQERSVYFEQMRKARDGKAGDAVAAEAIRRHVIEWDIVDHRKESLKITTPSILRLQPALFERLWEIVIGNEPCDVKPDIGIDEAESLEVQMSAALEETTPEDYIEKN